MILVSFVANLYFFLALLVMHLFPVTFFVGNMESIPFYAIFTFFYADSFDIEYASVVEHDGCFCLLAISEIAKPVIGGIVGGIVVEVEVFFFFVYRRVFFICHFDPLSYSH